MKDYDFKKINYPAIAAWVCGTLAAAFIKIGVAPLNGLCVAFVSYVVLYKLCEKIALNGSNFEGELDDCGQN